MLLLSQPYTLLLLAAVVIPAILAIRALKQFPNHLGTYSFAALMAGVSLWAATALISVLSHAPEIKIISYKFQYVFIVSTPAAWLTFCLFYANRMRVLRISTLILLMLPQGLTLAMVASNPMHHLMFTAFEMVTPGNHYLLYPHFGPWFWVHTTYCYLLMFAGFILLTKHLLGSEAHYRRPVVSVMIGGLAPWISNVLFIFKISPVPHFDLTPVAFIISGLAFMWGIVRYRLLDIIPIARDTVIQNMTDGVVVVDNGQHILDLNPAAARLLGMEPGKLIGAKANHIIAWWPTTDSTSDPTHDNRPPIIELNVDHQPCFVRLVQTLLYTNGKPLGFLFTLRDVTTTLRAERALRHSEERFKSLSENAPVVIFTLDNNGIITYINRAWQNTLGHPLRNVIHQPFAHFVSPEDNAHCLEMFAQLTSGQHTQTEANIYMSHQDGAMRLLNTSITTNSDAEGRIIGIIGMAKDVTTERRLQNQLTQSQKMQAVGTLAGGLAHDFNNLLMGMQANISMMRREIEPDTALLEKLNRIDDQIHNGVTLARQLLGYAHKSKHSIGPLEINPLIEDALHVVQRAKKNITIENYFPDKPIQIKADKGQIELVLLNLFLNAVDAMPEGGKLRVDSHLISSADLLRRWPQVAPHPYLEITVTDTGVGMDDDTRTQIFEPFFTTKPKGQGTGLGLATVYGTVQSHDGYIQVDSQPGKGATFRLLFPVLSPIERSRCREKDALAVAASGAKILLVEDEALILNYCSEMIQSLGHQVLTADSGQQAVKIYKDHIDNIDLVILDMIMPGMDGWQTYKSLKTLNSQVRVIVTSGHADDDRIEAILTQGRNGSLKKPYTISELGHAIDILIHPTDACVDQPVAETL